ncbi:TIGR03943 family putative permease subunit [Trujillonella humicola]|uniref:TIGR03943 family putative permease subunit n=1 Tax=Trujillonella humicola TaxID=3383699 RepID=UPI0039069C9D
MTSHAVLLLLGGYVLQVALTDAHLAYVQGAFRPFLLIAAVVLLAVALLGLLRVWRQRSTADDDPEGEDHTPDGHDHDDDEHGHAHGAPRVAWLLVAPVVVLALVAPPALGSFTVARQTTPAEVPTGAVADSLGPDDEGQDHRTLPLVQYRWRALHDDVSPLEGRQVRLTGFVVPREGGGWYVARIRISCCAADAVGVTVVVDGPQGDLVPDQWVEVVGTWAPPVTHPSLGFPEAVIAPVDVRPIETPADPYVF